MVQKKYKDIERLKDKYALAFNPGEHITISEKIDGANAAIAYDAETDILAAFSRRNILTPTNTLQGFYEYVQRLDKFAFKSVLGTRYILFGEWLVKHTIRYPDTAYKQFYAFDIWDTEIEEYIPWVEAKKRIDCLGLNHVPIFFDGAFTSWDDIYSYVGKTEMGAEPTGEGIVIKSQDRLNNKFSETPEYVKIVAKEFSEVHQSKPHNVDPEVLAAKQAAEDLAKTIVTPRRIMKGLEKMIEDDVIPFDWDEHHMSIIAKTLPKAIYNDCIKEEPETVLLIENFGKICGSLVMKEVRNFFK